ncbi:chromosome partitioning protein ParA [Eggerthellaceae bacterium zg-887]|uniref:chromosome partitioning protein ParA n=1 Tax=Xiamenia xianingshaonis TaxID=2682776 RepID=UPI00140C630B|nr:chromosome partitioning protein ParA [Xiamenia xianingshaonis]NHM16525.1 chromosome partitioning protein ParA [Xiamenia xianingshaonis]
MSRKKNDKHSAWSLEDDPVYEMAQAGRQLSETREKDTASSDGVSSAAVVAFSEKSEEIQDSIAEDTQAVLQEELAMAYKEIERLRRDLAEINKREALIALREESVSKAEVAVRERENAVWQAEIDRDSGYAAERAEHIAALTAEKDKAEKEIAEKRLKAIEGLKEELSGFRLSGLADIEKEADSERSRVRSSIDAERKSWEEEHKELIEGLARGRKECEEQRVALDAQLAEIAARNEELDQLQLSIEKQRERFEEFMDDERDTLEATVEKRVQKRKEEYEAKERESAEERESLLDQLTAQARLLASYEDLKRQLNGRQPQAVLTELNDLLDEISKLNEGIASGEATKQMKNRLDEAEARYNSAIQQIALLNSQRNEDAERLLGYGALQFELKEAQQELEIAQRIATNSEGEIARLSQLLETYQAAYDKPEARRERIAEIEKPYFSFDVARHPALPQQEEEIDEQAWLSGVMQKCEEYGLHFNPRLVKAFHTSLKTAEWSPITVLAGVSGTGKSELPRLYAHFGGLQFLPVSVQPNWDSKESMLGFFNSIDNRFDAEPMLRFLAQSQKDWRDPRDGDPGYPGLSEAVCLTLLDEMNLAHPELYFAEFLSKFEQRRGIEWVEDECPADFPKIDVKIGTGMEPFQIPLGRNMLWVGTMNQDETTKSLSDKVLDRAIVMTFPRPTKLKRRTQVKALDDSNRGEPLHIVTWDNWRVVNTSFDDDEILPYKQFVEKMNDCLEKAGRAIGHRVWQSVEYYMANYPDVRVSERGSAERKRAMHTAFEDQIVQKIMPKLRGIDTTGENEEKCLKPIGQLLGEGVGGAPFNLNEDFMLACGDLGYGQFVWQSANYLKEDEPSRDQEQE